MGFIFLFSYYLHEKTTTILPIMIWAHTSTGKSQKSHSWALSLCLVLGLFPLSCFAGGPTSLCTRFATKQREERDVR